jgi:hypothetical protein
MGSDVQHARERRRIGIEEVSAWLDRETDDRISRSFGWDCHRHRTMD